VGDGAAVVAIVHLLSTLQPCGSSALPVTDLVTNPLRAFPRLGAMSAPDAGEGERVPHASSDCREAGKDPRLRTISSWW